MIGGVDELRRLHTSDSAVVYSGFHRGLGRDVAVKVFSGDDPKIATRVALAVERFREASNNPSLVTLYESGVTPAGHPFVVFDLCDSSVRSFLDQGTKLGSDDACLLVADMAGAVEVIHGLGISHNQIRPSNLLLKDGLCLLSDFGSLGAMTTVQTVSIGQSTAYLAPEVLEQNSAARPADVYALGATLYHLVTGRAPFVTDDDDPQILSMLFRIATAEVPDLRDEGVPDAVCLVIESAMRKNPGDRPTISELRSMLHAAAGVDGDSQYPQWKAGAELASAAAESAAVSDVSDEEPGLDVTDELDLDALSALSTTHPSSQSPTEPLDDPFLSNPVSDEPATTLVTKVGFDQEQEISASTSGDAADQSAASTANPPAADFSPPSPPGNGAPEPLLKAIDPPPPVLGDQSKAIESAQGAELAASSASGSTAPSGEPSTVVTASGPADVLSSLNQPPPPTADAFVRLGDAPARTSPSTNTLAGAAATLGSVFESIRTKTAQYIAEVRAAKTTPESGAIPLSFSTDELSDQTVEVRLDPRKEEDGTLHSPLASFSTDIQVQTPHSVPENSADDSPFSSSSVSDSSESREVIPGTESPEELSIAELSAAEFLSAKPVAADATSAAEVPVAELTTRSLDSKETSDSSTGAILSGSSSSKTTSNVSLTIDNSRQAILEAKQPEADTQGSAPDLYSGNRTIVPPAPTSAGRGGVQGAIRDAKHLSQSRFDDAVRKLRGQENDYFPAHNDERFSSKTLMLAGAAVVLFVVFSTVVALSFRGSGDEDFDSVAPADPATATTDQEGSSSSANSSFGQSGTDLDGGEPADPSIGSIDEDPEPVVLSSQVDRDQTTAVQSLNVKGIPTEVVEEPSKTIESGKVIRSEPEAGVELAPNQVVTLYVSTGPPGTIVRNVVGQPQADAVAVLQQAGFNVVVEEASNETVEKGLVVGSSPGGGTKQPNGSRVTLTVSTGPACAGSIVPQVVGLELPAAQEALGAVELQSSVQQVVDGAAAPGSVISTEPGAEQCAETGSAISLSVACQSATVPPREGFSVDNAASLGFEVEVQRVQSDQVPPGQLVSVEPAHGTTVCTGTRLIVTLNQDCDLKSVPDVIGRNVFRANRNILRANLRAVYIEEPNSSESRGDVFRTEPGPGAQLCSGSQVTVYVSLGEQDRDDD